MALIARIKKFTNNLKLDTQTAIETSRARLGAQGTLLLGAIGLVFLSFVILAIIAPLGVRTGGLFSTILSVLPFLVLMGGLYFAIRGLWNTFKTGQKSENIVQKGAIAKSAIEIALNEIIEAGLLGEGERQYDDCLSGKVDNLAIVSLKTQNMGFCVIRLKQDFASIIMALPRGQMWPIKMPTDKKLSPLSPPSDDLEAWSFENLTSRDRAQNLLDALAQPIGMAAVGGELPFLYVQGRTLIFGFRNADIGAISLIGNEAARCIGKI